MTIRGTIHGNTIELETDPGMPDGQTVEIDLRVSQRSDAWGEGIRRSAGIASDLSRVDEVFEELARERRVTLSQF